MKKPKPEDRCVLQLECIKRKAVDLMCEIDKALDYFDRHKKDFKK
jgi:hypothetical protein